MRWFDHACDLQVETTAWWNGPRKGEHFSVEKRWYLPVSDASSFRVFFSLKSGSLVRTVLMIISNVWSTLQETKRTVGLPGFGSWTGASVTDWPLAFLLKVGSVLLDNTPESWSTWHLFTQWVSLKACCKHRENKACWLLCPGSTSSHTKWVPEAIKYCFCLDWKWIPLELCGGSFFLLHFLAPCKTFFLSDLESKEPSSQPTPTSFILFWKA